MDQSAVFREDSGIGIATHSEDHAMAVLPQRRSMRLPGFNYRSPGPYAFTICNQSKIWRFATVTPPGSMNLNPGGRMVEEMWYDIPRMFPGTISDEMVVMPNQLHGILHLGTNDISTNPDLSEVIGWLKAVTTNRYIHGVQEHGWNRFNKVLWQRQFYDHIIRTHADFQRCQAYIGSNPVNWMSDRDREIEPQDVRKGETAHAIFGEPQGFPLPMV